MTTETAKPKTKRKPAAASENGDLDAKAPRREDAKQEEPLRVSAASAPLRQSLRTITITLPVCQPDADSYIAHSLGRINTRLDRCEQLDGLRQLHAGLRETNATLASGRPVDGAPDVLRWLFEQIQEQLVSGE